MKAHINYNKKLGYRSVMRLPGADIELLNVRKIRRELNSATPLARADQKCMRMKRYGGYSYLELKWLASIEGATEIVEKMLRLNRDWWALQLMCSVSKHLCDND